MAWEFEETTEQVATKDYNCDACDWVNNDFANLDLSFSELRSYALAKRDKFKIKKGQMYTKTKGKWDGEFCTFRARIDIDKICLAHFVY